MFSLRCWDAQYGMSLQCVLLRVILLFLFLSLSLFLSFILSFVLSVFLSLSFLTFSPLLSLSSSARSSATLRLPSFLSLHSPLLLPPYSHPLLTPALVTPGSLLAPGSSLLRYCADHNPSTGKVISPDALSMNELASEATRSQSQ